MSLDGKLGVPKFGKAPADRFEGGRLVIDEASTESAEELMRQMELLGQWDDVTKEAMNLLTDRVNHLPEEKQTAIKTKATQIMSDEKFKEKVLRLWESLPKSENQTTQSLAKGMLIKISPEIGLN